MEVIVLLIVLVVGGLYFIPSIVALMREHPSRAGIIILNIFLGWTLVGWVVSLAWAASSTGRE